MGTSTSRRIEGLLGTLAATPATAAKIVIASISFSMLHERPSEASYASDAAGRRSVLAFSKCGSATKPVRESPCIRRWSDADEKLIFS